MVEAPLAPSGPKPEITDKLQSLVDEIRQPRHPPAARLGLALSGEVAFTAPAGPQSLRDPLRPFGGLGCFQSISQVVSGGPAGEEAEGVVVG